MSDSNVFHRRDYAQALAQQLLEPGPLDQGLRSGVFLSGIRRIGKTTFVRQDFIPALLDREVPRCPAQVDEPDVVVAVGGFESPGTAAGFTGVEDGDVLFLFNTGKTGLDMGINHF